MSENKKGSQSDLELLLEKSKVANLFLDDKLFEEAVQAGLTEREKAARAVLEGRRVTRAFKQTTAKRKVHWRTKKRWRKNYYHEVTVPKNRERRAALLEGDGWGLVHDYWHRKSIAYTITREEWMDNVEEFVTGKMFTVNRYDTTKPISLENIIVRETRTRAVLFDGKECKLRAMGYIL